MYVQNEIQQAQQQREDLQNKVDNIKNDDASKLEQLTDDIKEKRKVLRSDMDRVQTLTDEYQRDHDMGEGMNSDVGAATLAHAVDKQQQQNLKKETLVADQ